MSQDQHLRSELYVLSRNGGLGRGAFALRLHRHLVRVCPACGEGWRLLAEGQERVEEALLKAVEAAPPEPEGREEGPLHHRAAFSWEARQLEEEVREVRKIQGEAAKKAWFLVDAAPEDRLAKVRRARTRYRSRAEAEYLLDKARECVREDPREAASLAATARAVVEQIPGADGTEWAAGLAVRADARRADALRRTGDLPAAERGFARIRAEMAETGVADLTVAAEAARLEASLRIDQGRLPEAHYLLELAAVVYGCAGDVAGRARVQVRQGELWLREGNPDRALEGFDAALQALPADGGDLRLRLAALDGALDSLCELGRFREAADRLDRHLDLYEEAEELCAGARVRHHRGRIALGLERFRQAEEDLNDACHAFLAAERGDDALVVALDLAQLFAVTGRPGRLKRLAAQLVRASHAVGPEAQAALELLAEAAEAEPGAPDLLQRLRRRPARRT